jgi:hypothetical protein
MPANPANDGRWLALAAVAGLAVASGISKGSTVRTAFVAPEKKTYSDYFPVVWEDGGNASVTTRESGIWTLAKLDVNHEGVFWRLILPARAHDKMIAYDPSASSMWTVGLKRTSMKVTKKLAEQQIFQYERAYEKADVRWAEAEKAEAQAKAKRGSPVRTIVSMPAKPKRKKSKLKWLDRDTWKERGLTPMPSGVEWWDAVYDEANREMVAFSGGSYAHAGKYVARRTSLNWGPAITFIRPSPVLPVGWFEIVSPHEYGGKSYENVVLIVHGERQAKALITPPYILPEGPAEGSPLRTILPVPKVRHNLAVLDESQWRFAINDDLSRIPKPSNARKWLAIWDKTDRQMIAYLDLENGFEETAKKVAEFKPLNWAGAEIRVTPSSHVKGWFDLGYSERNGEYIIIMVIRDVVSARALAEPGGVLPDL